MTKGVIKASDELAGLDIGISSAGDWLVDYGDGSLGIVSPAIFATTYEIIG